MAAACTSMDIHDRRLAISKASASKISKPSPSPLLKSLSSAASSSSSGASPSSSPPRPATVPPTLPFSITSSPSRPIAKVVNADPSSFRRVVQELTGTSPSSSATASPRSAPSRLQRIAPPPLRAALRNSFPEHQQQQILLEQMQHQQAPHMLLLQQHITKVGAVLSPPLSFPEVSSSNSNLISNSTHFANPNPGPGSESAPPFGHTNPNFSQSLPMLSPHLLSPLPALTPGDSTWANPIEVMAHSPKFMESTLNSLPPLLPLPTVSTSTSNNVYGNGLLPKPAYTSNRSNDGMSARQPGSAVANLVTSHGQSLPPLLSTSLQTTFNGVLPPWSPSPLPYSPGLFPPSPGLGLPPTTTELPLFSNVQYNNHSKYGSMNPTMPNNFTF